MTEEKEAGVGYRCRTQFTLQLVVTRFHVGTELVKRLVVQALFEVGEFVHAEHFQELFGPLFEQAGHTDFPFGLAGAF